MTYNIAISPAKASRLYWLGRYSERVCSTLHMLHKCYDEVVDNEHTDVHSDFCVRMGIPFEYDNAREFLKNYLYNKEKTYSVINMLERVKDNAILLREELKSESLAYVEMAINYMNQASMDESRLYDLQPVTDYLFAFFGAIEERIFNVDALNLILIGKYVEKSELYIRFDYDLSRIDESLCRLEHFVNVEVGLCDDRKMSAVRNGINEMPMSASIIDNLNTIFAA